MVVPVLMRCVEIYEFDNLKFFIIYEGSLLPLTITVIFTKKRESWKSKHGAKKDIHTDIHTYRQTIGRQADPFAVKK